MDAFECTVYKEEILRVADPTETRPPNYWPFRNWFLARSWVTSTTMANVTSTTMTIGGIPTVLVPLPTPYPSMDGCGANIYQLSSAAPTFLAWDPDYGKNFTDAASCLPPQVSTWWDQAPGLFQIYTGLGPTFACPEAYSTVSTTVTASSVQEVYCCPSYVTQPRAERPTCRKREKN